MPRLITVESLFSDRVSREVVKHSEMGMPPIQDWTCLAEPHGFGWGVTGELIMYPAQ